jgi:hypothetical protein
MARLDELKLFTSLHLIDNADLDAVSETCRKHNRYEFQFVMAPLVLKQGTASPVNPLALF